MEIHETGISAIVLAAGESKRMGGINKLLLPHKNKSVIGTVIENIARAGFFEINVVLGHEEARVKEALQDLKVNLIFNKNFREGMTTSIQKGVEIATGAGYMICLADMVLIGSEEYLLMGENFSRQFERDEKCICIPRFQKEKGNPVIFSSYYRSDILNHEEMEGCKAIVHHNEAHIYWIEMNTRHVLRDIDYKEDYMNLDNE